MIWYQAWVNGSNYYTPRWVDNKPYRYKYYTPRWVDNKPYILIQILKSNLAKLKNTRTFAQKRIF